MNSILVNKPKKNNFDLSHEVKMTGNMGNLYPCFIQDVIPGDSFKVDTQQLIRFSPLLAPMMHNVDFKLDYFFVPYRLVWDEWKDFITGGEDGNDLPSFPRFKVTSNSFANAYLQKGSLADYLGVPPNTGTAGNEGGAWNTIAANSNSRQALSILPFRAYQLIWHEYFRDQNVGTEYEQYTDSGLQPDSGGRLTAQLTLRKSNWEKDYFTSSLPFLQRGGEVSLPLGDIAPIVYGDYDHLSDSTSTDRQYARKPYSVDPAGYMSGNIEGYATDSRLLVGGSTGNIDISGTHAVDLSSATGATINELRRASAIQQWLELMARAGSRYREQIYAIFGEKIPDYTVQIPKYLGGGKTPIMISEVLSTYAQTSSASSGTSQDRPQGDMSGHALALGDNIGFTESFDEHGIILGLCRVIPKASYVQGLSRFWQKFGKFDHYFPQFANLGEQEVYNKEIYIEGNTTDDDAIFGYQQRYAEYKYAQNRVAGDFRDTLAHWELSRRFTGAAPLLNQSFIECTPDDRIFAIEDANEDKIWMSLYHKVNAIRPIPYFSNPSLT
jgi:hypothetical protein